MSFVKTLTESISLCKWRLKYHDVPCKAILIFVPVACVMWLAAGAGEERITFQTGTSLPATLDFSPTPEKHLIETMAGGVALLDYDGDGKLDVFLTNGAAVPSLRKAPAFANRLYRNQGGGRFEDVTGQAGVRGEGFSIGVAAGDYDNDGHVDLFVAGVNHDLLYHNQGDGTFREVTAQAGLTGPAEKEKPWSAAAGWFDYDRDGLLDLFVVHYVRWDATSEPYCGDQTRGVRTYCHPREYAGLPNALYHNEGGGRFRDVSVSSGVARHTGKGMSVAFADYDSDGDLDVFVTNDTEPNFLYRNEGDGSFREVGAQAGVAFNDDGRALSSMGVDWRDIDNDGREDLFLTALMNETFPLFHNLGKGLFADHTYSSLAGKATRTLSGWGAAIVDLDNDGWKDLISVNGDVQTNTGQFSGRASRQGVLALRNLRDGKFAAVPVPVAEAWHRGLAVGDLNGDGRMDLLISRLGESPLMLLNTSRTGAHWLQVRLQGRRSNRQGLGARVKLTDASGKVQWNIVTSAAGYASASEAVAHFGLGEEGGRVRLEIQWPSGVVQTSESLVDRGVVVEEPERSPAKAAIQGDCSRCKTPPASRACCASASRPKRV